MTALTDLQHEWDNLTQTGAFADAFDNWLCSWPELDTLLNTKTLSRTDADRILYALLNAHSNGTQYAGRIVLQCMTPAINSIVKRSAYLYDTPEDAAQQALAAMWNAINEYDLSVTERVASRLWSRTLNATATMKKRVVEIPTGDSRLGLVESATPAPVPFDTRHLGPTGEVLQLIAWGLDHEILSRSQAALLTRLYADTTPDSAHWATHRQTVAAELGVSERTLRRRASEAVRTLATHAHRGQR